MTDESPEPFGIPDFVPQSESGCRTSDINVFNGSAARNSLVETMSGSLQLDNKNSDTYLFNVVDEQNAVLLG
jgi:hypothetical protein